MRTTLPVQMHRALDRLRERGEPVSLRDLARQMLALRRPVEPALARRLVATALERPESSLPERIDAGELRPGHEAAVADEPIERADFAVVDLETSGLSPERCEILEIGAVRVSRLRRKERFETLVRPRGRLPRAIVELTGIEDAAAREAPPPRRALRAFRRWLERTPSAPFVAHNASFDAGFVERGLASHGLTPYRGPVLCTRQLARRIAPEIGRYNLDHLCAHFGIDNRARHRAAGDAEATARALVELLQLARTRHGLRTVGDLIDLQRRPPERRRRR